ncbi:hypothetical protein BGZ79_001227 [Entomortierella chlamydospora]|nr:hypothetical protein BGZ79_001227 [Entomortierella chlamydospora]
MFRCTPMKHGFKYHGLHDQSVQSIRERTKPGDNEINISLLGETGVGKSTFINAFANYLKYSYLEETEMNEMTTLIHSSFEIAGTKVVVGEDDKNERLTNGDSSTQKCRAYEFPYKDDKMIRFIDTPGIGDTRGVKQDRVNFEGILDFISGYDKINGICILLLPDVSHEIDFYQAGATLTPLATYIKELETKSQITIRLEPNTMYYFDNEAFKLYAALKQNIAFDAKTKKLYGDSWVQSVEESRRLINRVMDLKPHRTEETLTLDNARRSIFQLVVPMTKINENIAIELQAIQVLKKLAETHQISAQDLKERLIETYMDLNPINLTHPRTVCTSDGCSTVQGNIVRYNKHCHNHCYIGNVSITVLRHASLRICSKMSFSGICKTCGCKWDKHMHVRIDYEEVKKQKTNATVAEKLQETELKTESMQQEISKADTRVKSLESEKKQIFDGLMTFTGFLLQNSIVQQNSGILDYIDMSIRNQERVAKRTKDNSIVESLRQQRREYVVQKEVFENAKKEGKLRSGVITLEDVIEARDGLCRLENNGQALASVLRWGEENQVLATKRETRLVKPHKSSDYNGGYDTSAAYSSHPSTTDSYLAEGGDASRWGAFKKNVGKHILVPPFSTLFTTRLPRNNEASDERTEGEELWCM